MLASRKYFLLFLTFCVLFVLIGRTGMFRDPDTFWHIAIGRRILETQHVPYQDEFSAPFEGQPWLSHSWLSECLMAWLDQWGGFDAVLWFQAALLACFFSWLASRLIASGAHALLVALGIACLFLASSHNLHTRPLVFSFVFQGVVAAWLLDVETGRRSIRSLCFLPLLIGVWANLHPGVLGGIGTIGLALASFLIAWLLRLRTPITSRREASVVILSGMAVLVAPLINPYGWEILIAWKRNLEIDLPHLIIEHGRLNPLSGHGLAVIALTVTCLVTLVSSPVRNWRLLSWIVFVWAFLAFSRSRHALLFAPFACLWISDAVPNSRIGQWLKGRGWWHPAPSQATNSWRWGVACFAVALLPFMMSAVAMSTSRPYPTPAYVVRPDQHVWPIEFHDAITQIKREADRPLFVLNDQMVGGYLLYHFPQDHVFVDGRCELYGEEFLKGFVESSRRDSFFDEWLSAIQWDLALVTPGSALDRHLAARDDWMVVRQSDAVTLRTPIRFDGNDRPAVTKPE